MREHDWLGERAPDNDASHRPSRALDVGLTRIRFDSELLVAGDMDGVPFFCGWMIEKIGAATKVKGRQLILGPVFKALPKFARRFGEFRSTVGILSPLIGVEVGASARERNVSRTEEAVDRQRLRSAL